MFWFVKNKLFAVVIWILMLIGCILPLSNFTEATAPTYEDQFVRDLENGWWVLKPENFGVESKKTLKQNITDMLYPSASKGNDSKIYDVVKGATLWVMILFIVWAGASLLISWKKPEEAKKHLYSLLYILLGGVFIYGASWLFWNVLSFGNDALTNRSEGGIGWVADVFVWKGSVLFVVLSAVKAFAFFLAIIMIVITWFKVMAAWDWDKWKKLVKWLINVIVALLIIKWVDFIYYLAADGGNFVAKSSDFIINVAKVFGWIYWVIVVLMVIIAGYLYVTDGWSWSNFKKASNVLVNILLSGLVLFSFLLITYQIFAEFQTGGDAVEDSTVALLNLSKFYV